MAVDSSTRTRNRILDASERLFANRGFDAASLRAITSAAQVNLAAVNYHFGSKESLIEEVFARRLGPLNAERLELLDALEASESASPTLEEIVEAFIGPALRLRHSTMGPLVILRLLGHAMSQPDDKIRQIFTEQFREVVRRFLLAIHQLLPEHSEVELAWRFLFMVGTMAHTMALADDMEHMTAGLCDPNDTEAIIRRMVPFICAGLTAQESDAGRIDQ